MGYRNDKRRAAIWLLKRLVSPYDKMIIKGTTEREEILSNPEKHYPRYKFTELLSKCKYSQEKLKGAIEMLSVNNHIGRALQTFPSQDFDVWGVKEGEEALNDRIYQDDIETYNNDKYYRHLRWWLPVLTVLISLTSLYFSIWRKPSGNIIQVQSPIPQIQQPYTPKKILPSQDTSNPARKVPDSLNKNGK